MKNNWAHLLKGYVRVRIDGAHGERFLNRCIDNNVSIWTIKRVGEDRIICYMDLEDAKRIRPLLRITSCKVTFTERRGLPFLLQKMLQQIGFVGGMMLCIALILILSNIVWKIEINGASPEVEHELRQVVSEMGVKRGAFHFSLPSVEEIQRDVTERIRDATWVGVRQNGTTYQFEVVQQLLPEEAEQVSPRHLVAKRKAIIHDVFVEHGQALVKPNDYVQKGDMLVSGFIGREGKTELVPAVATVLGEIWYLSDVTIPLKSTFSTLTGNSVVTHKLSFFGFDVPVWGLGKHDFVDFRELEETKDIHLFRWTLPIQYKNKKIAEASTFEREYSKEQAKEKAMEVAKNELLKRIPEDAVVRGEKVLHQSVENGKVKLKIHYQVIEDITSEMPIIQGD
ncbi:sporulation protein YqfD [Halalkalibacterium ligniniphilum]|uniref:sporulation protein YqfD n=1 Tax=Halalkalibacterium ligniniphilum TaxID=1134413 RepID=UPI000348470D|nr:sporulation protein YqfD [Halalkalibacterium ligniniphilum]